MPDKTRDHSEAPYAGKRLTRADVERLIAEHGGPEGLDLRGVILAREPLGEMDLRKAILWFACLDTTNLSSAKLQQTQLWNARLREADLRWAELQEAELGGADLQGARLEWAHLQGADLRKADLRKANLVFAELQGADLREARLSGVRLSGARFDYETDLSGAIWDGYVVDEERVAYFEEAQVVYRRLREWYRQHGYYDVASEFAYRENEARRKARWQKVRKLWQQLRQPAEASAQ